MLPVTTDLSAQTQFGCFVQDASLIGLLFYTLSKKLNRFKLSQNKAFFIFEFNHHENQFDSVRVFKSSFSGFKLEEVHLLKCIAIGPVIWFELRLKHHQKRKFSYLFFPSKKESSLFFIWSKAYFQQFDTSKSLIDLLFFWK